MFKNCSRLTSITIPASVTSIGDNAFYGCSGLESITAETDNTIYHSAGNCLIETESKTLITGCKNSVIPTDGSVTSIGDNAFYGCTGLVSMKIPDSVTSVGDGAFLGCTNLKTLIVPNGLNITQASVDITKVKHTYSIIYNSGIGTNIDPQTKITSESVQLASNAKNGYLFKGWSDEKNGKVIYLPGAVYSDDANIVLYGIWAKTCPKTTTSFEPCPNAKCKNGYVGTQNCTECNGTGWLYNSTKCSECNGWGFKNIYHIDKSVICPYCKGIIGLNKDCTWCHGCGYYVTKIEKKNCAKCDGKGSIITTKGCPYCTNGKVKVKCSDCEGKGRIEITSVCEKCNGSGEVPYIVSYDSNDGAEAPVSQNKVPGDINGDGSVNNKDLTRLFQYLSDWDVDVNEVALDINGDGKVNNKDLTRLFKYLSDWDVDIS